VGPVAVSGFAITFLPKPSSIKSGNLKTTLLRDLIDFMESQPPSSSPNEESTLSPFAVPRTHTPKLRSQRRLKEFVYFRIPPKSEAVTQVEHLFELFAVSLS
jgi:hypothetical protein